MSNKFEFRPTLMIGLGGTGTTILTAIKGLLLDNIGEDIFSTIHMLAIDTDDRLPEVRRRNGDIVRLNNHTEYVNIGYVPVASIMQNLKGYPEIAAWMPPELPLPAIAQGARMVRLLGRLSLFFHFRRISDALRPKIRELRHLTRTETSYYDTSGGVAGVGAETPGVNVFIIASLCGGTGAGTFLDIALLARKYCTEMVRDGTTVFVNGALVLPSAFPSVRAQGRIAANTKACLDDLDQLMRYGFNQETYPGNYTVTMKNVQPFNVCYLVDAINRDGDTLNGLDELAPLLATSIYLQIASQVGPATKSRFDNVHSLSDDYHGRVTAYSGMGCAKLVFPARRMIDLCARRFCETFIERKLLRPAVIENVLEQLWQAFSGEHHISREALMTEMLSSADRRQPRIVTGISQAAVTGVSIDLIIERLQRVVETTERKLDDQQAKQMQSNWHILDTKLVNALADQIDRLVNDPAYGLNTALAFTEYLEGALARFSEALNEAREQVAFNVATETARCRETFQTLNNAVNVRLPIWRNRQVTSASTDYVRSQDQRLRHRLALMQYDQVLSLLSSLRNHASEYRRTYTNLRDRLANIVHELVGTGDQRLDPEQEIERLTLSVVGENDVETYYERFLPGEGQWLSLVTQHCGAVAQWRGLSPQQLRDVLTDFARQPFAPLEKITIEEFIGSSNSRDAQAAWLNRVRRRAVPFWKRSQGMDSRLDDPDEIRVLGVLNQENSLFSGRQEQGEELVTMNDPHTVAMLRTEHGLPTTALNFYPDYGHSYEQYYRDYQNSDQLVPLRLFDPATRAQVPDETVRARRVFAVGQLFGHIGEDENGVFYFRRRDERNNDGWQNLDRLSRDLQNAVEVLMSRTALMDEIEAFARRYQADHGKIGLQQLVLKHLENSANHATDLVNLRAELNATLKQWSGLE